MGGQSFLNIGVGKTPEDAFNRLADEARYQHGHGGYTGTIAEKPGFILLSVPPKVAALDMAKWAQSYVPPEHRRAEWRKTEWKPQYPPELEYKVIEGNNVANDKWGPAAAYEIKGEELEALKKVKDYRVPRAVADMPKDSRAFVFFGMASS